MKHGHMVLLLVLALQALGCAYQGPEFKVVDADSGAPLQGGKVLRYGYRVSTMFAPYEDERTSLSSTDEKGQTNSGLLQNERSYEFRFDSRGYSPALVITVERPRRGLIFSPWNGDVAHPVAVGDKRKMNVVPMKRLPADQKDADSAASLPAMPEHWDGIWRLQVVDPVTGSPMSGVQATYRDALRGDPPVRIVSDSDGIIQPKFPVPARRWVFITLEKPGCQRVSVQADGNCFVCESPSPNDDRSIASLWPAGDLYTVPMFRLKE